MSFISHCGDKKIKKSYLHCNGRLFHSVKVIHRAFFIIKASNYPQGSRGFIALQLYAGSGIICAHLSPAELRHVNNCVSGRAKYCFYAGELSFSAEYITG